MNRAKQLSKSIRLICSRVSAAVTLSIKLLFKGSCGYWESRYAAGNTSGVGSYGKWAEFKAEVLNDFVSKHKISSIIEFGCGDGNQLSLARYPAYIGLDVSSTAIEICKERFRDDKTKIFHLYVPECLEQPNTVYETDLAISLDVIYHLVQDRIFDLYMKHLFSVARKFVIIYSMDSENNSLLHLPHVKHRNFSKWIDANIYKWKLFKHIPNKYITECNKIAGAQIDFFIYKKIDG